jgi:hypothetical protein
VNSKIGLTAEGQPALLEPTSPNRGIEPDAGRSVGLEKLREAAASIWKDLALEGQP